MHKLKITMIKRLIICAIACVTFTTATADEGMWLPSLIKERIKEMRKVGFKLKASDIYSDSKPSLKDAVMQFGGGCTGEFISPDGLLLTNHHCGYASIQKLSSVEHDYLTDGYWAMSRSEELPVPGLTITLLVKMEDVTARLAAGEEKQAIIDAAKKEYNTDKAQVEPMYYGNQHYLFVYRTFRDVRLVGAPPSSIGKFGGDTDNWIWPRHTGDFSMFRVYANANNEPADYSENNVPYHPKRYLPISTKGVEEGDFTMIYGFPGNTQEYVTADAVDYVVNISNPMKIALRTTRLDIISEAQSKDVATRIAYAAKHANIANAWKKWQGESLGLARRKTVEKKLAYEAEFEKWAVGTEYEGITAQLHEKYMALLPYAVTRDYYNEAAYAVELLGFARGLAKLSEAGYKDYSPAIDRAVAKEMFADLSANVAEDYLPEFYTAKVAELGSTDALTDWLFDNSRLVGKEAYAAAVAEGYDFTSDPAVVLLGAFDALYKEKIAPHYASLNKEITALYNVYMRGQMAHQTERTFYPDANLTLRVAYGSVAGYEAADGVYHLPYTTIDGIIEKDNPEIYDYDIPQSLRDIYASKDYGRWGIERDGKLTLPVAFLAKNHTTGGNSGSPILNSKGQLLGINFDRTWLSTMSDLDYDADICRNISVDIRYVLFVIDKIGGAGYLIDEMTLD